MKVFEIKATLLRSNPQLVRVFVVSCDISFKKLHEIIQLVIGCRKRCEWEITYNEITVTNEELDFDGRKRKTGVDAGSALRTVVKAGSCMQYRFGNGLKWTVRLQVTEIREEDESGVPRVTRYRGDNLNGNTQNVRDYNYVQLAIKNRCQNRRMWEFPEGNPFLEEQTNRELQMRFGKKKLVEKAQLTADFLPDFASAIPIKQLFENDTVDTLRYYADYMNFQAPSGLRKKQLIEMLVLHYQGTGLITRCLKEMSLQEYERAKVLYQQSQMYVDDDEWKMYGTLERYCMVCRRENGVVVCTREFLQGYQMIIREGYEPTLYRQKKVEAVIYVGCRLYGVITEDGIRELLDKYYPGEYTVDDVKSICRELRKDKSTRWESAPGGVFFDGRAMNKRDTGMFLEGAAMFSRYIPEREEYERVEGCGLFFDGDAGKELEGILIDDIGMYPVWAEHYHRELYRGLQTGMSAEGDVRWLFTTVLEKKNRKQEDKLENWLALHTGKVRKYMLNGHTDEEIRQLQKLQKRPEEPKKVRIFPNDPCPCGSGKKYKKCCGRR